MADTAHALSPAHDQPGRRRIRPGTEHVLAEARVRALSARPVGPMKVRRTHGHPARAD